MHNIPLERIKSIKSPKEARLPRWELAGSLLGFCKGRADGFLHGCQVYGDKIANAIFSAYDFIFETFYKRKYNASWYRRHEIDPVSR